MTDESPFRAYNFVQVTPRIATSGVVPADEFAVIREAGYGAIINLLPSDNQYALEDEGSIVQALGFEYTHIPIDIEAPTARDYERFEAAMDAASARPVWVHCAANWRVSAFVGMYAERHLGWSREQSGALVEGIWEPTAPWIALRDRVREDEV